MTADRRRTPVSAAGRALRGSLAATTLGVVLAGIPWAAWHWVGWPLPSRVPSWAEVQAVLSQPASTALLVDVLTCAGWLLWMAFAVEVARSTVDAARAVLSARAAVPAQHGAFSPLPIDWSAGPLRAAAAALVGVLLLALLGGRTGPAQRASAADQAPTTPIAATPAATATPTATAGAAPAWADGGRPVAFTGPTRETRGTAALVRRAPDAPARRSAVVVRAASRRVHDSLWRIADRELGDGARWPELFTLNKGRVQADGQRLATPNLIYPGWRLLLPAEAHAGPGPVGQRRGGDQHPGNLPPRSPSVPTTPQPAPSSTAPADTQAPDPTTTPNPTAATDPSTAPEPTANPPDSAPATASPPPAGASAPAGGASSPAAGPETSAGPPPAPGVGLPVRRPGIELPGGGYVGLSLAGLLAAALVSLGAWRRRHRGGSPELAEPGFPPVIRALRLAHADAVLPDPDLSDHVAAAQPHHRERSASPAGASVPRIRARGSVGFTSDTPGSDGGADGLEPAGDDDRRGATVDLAGTRGLGLNGPGAADAARALLVDLLARRHEPDAAPIEILVPADTLAVVLPGAAGVSRPSRLRATTDLDTALDVAEVELLTRARLSADQRARLGTLVLLVTPHPHAQQRLQAILDNGSTLGVIGILLGQWRPGATVRIRPDGTVAAASPGLADVLTGARLFTVPPTHADTLIGLLTAADPAAADRENGNRTSADSTEPETVEPDVSDRDMVSSPGAEHADGGPVSGGKVRGPAKRSAPDGHDPDRPDPDGSGSDPPAHGGAIADGATATGSPRADGDLRARPGGAVRTAPDHLPRPAPLHLAVLGRLHLHDTTIDTGANAGAGIASERGDLIGAMAPRQREVLVYLALHRDGARREALAAALWPEAPAERPYNSLHATLSQMRRALAKATGGAVRELIVHSDGHYRLDPALLDVDLWRLRDTLTATHNAGSTRNAGPDRIAALRRIPRLYGADLAPDTDADWLTGPREALRRDVLDAIATLVQLDGDDPQEVLTWLEHSRTLDPYNEALYRDIMRTQARLAQHGSISRTMAVLKSALLDIDRQPDPETQQLADRLANPHPGPDIGRRRELESTRRRC